MSRKLAQNYFGGSYGWSGDGFGGWKYTVKKSLPALKKLKRALNFDAIAITGSSGAALAFYASIHLDVPVIYVRKARENSHGQQIESNVHGAVKRYIIVDDFIDSGATVNRIISHIDKQCKKRLEAEPECVGIFLYAESDCTFSTKKGVTIPVFGV